MYPNIFITSFVLAIPYVTCFEELNHKPDLNFGKYTSWEDCPAGSYARAFEIKGQDVNAKNYDDLGMTGLRLFCDTPTIEENQRIITSGVMREGTWKGKQTCPRGGWLIGFKVKIQPYQGFLRDDSGANNMRMLCSTGDYVSGRGLPNGSWSRWSRCRRGSVICGLRTKIEDIAVGDEMGLVALRMKCCRFKLPATTSTTSTTTPASTTTLTTTVSTTTSTETPASTTTSTIMPLFTTTSTTTPVSTTTYAATFPQTNLLTTIFNSGRPENTTANTPLLLITLNTQKMSPPAIGSTSTIANGASGKSGSSDRKISITSPSSRSEANSTTESEGTSVPIFNGNTTVTTPLNPIPFSKSTTGFFHQPITTYNPLSPALPSEPLPSTNNPGDKDSTPVLSGVTASSDPRIKPGFTFISVIPTPVHSPGFFVPLSATQPDKETEESPGNGNDDNWKSDSGNHHDIPGSQTSPGYILRSDGNSMPDLFTSPFVQSTTPSSIKFPNQKKADESNRPSSTTSPKISSSAISPLAITTLSNAVQTDSGSSSLTNDDQDGNFFGLDAVPTRSSSTPSIQTSLASNSPSTPIHPPESTLITLIFAGVVTKSYSTQYTTSLSPRRKVDLKPRINVGIPNVDGLQETNPKVTTSRATVASFPDQASGLPRINSDLPLTFASPIDNQDIAKTNPNKEIVNETIGKDLIPTMPSLLNDDASNKSNFPEKELANLPVNDTDDSFANRRGKSITLSLKGYDIDISDKMEKVSHPVYLMLTLALLAASLITVTWLIYAVKKGRKKSKRKNKVDPRHKYVIKVRPIKPINNDNQ